VSVGAQRIGEPNENVDEKNHRTADERAGVSIAVTWATREQLSPKPVWLVVFNFTKVRPTIAVIVDVVEDAQGHGRRNCLMIPRRQTGSDALGELVNTPLISDVD
jgi:hypothetical protein